MRKFLICLFAGFIGFVPMMSNARANGLDFDTSDPLFMLKTNDVLSETALTYWDNILRLVGTAASNSAHIISDVLFGLKFGGSSRVRTPDYADSTYYAGYRFGRQWAGVTLAATIKSSWIFDDDRGMAYIDFKPEAYFRIAPDWRLGAQFTLRKATDSHYNQEWLGGKIVRQYGRTQYGAHLDYEFESRDLQVGLDVNILF